jgi:hypothetical protein
MALRLSGLRPCYDLLALLFRMSSSQNSGSGNIEGPTACPHVTRAFIIVTHEKERGAGNPGSAHTMTKRQ